MSYIATFLRGAIIGLLVAFICCYTKKSKVVKSVADLRYSVESLRERVNYYEIQLSNCCVRIDKLKQEFERMNKPINIEEYITTNRVWITRDPIDNMPMYSVDNNGGLAL